MFTKLLQRNLPLDIPFVIIDLKGKYAHITADFLLHYRAEQKWYRIKKYCTDIAMTQECERPKIFQKAGIFHFSQIILMFQRF